MIYLIGLVIVFLSGLLVYEKWQNKKLIDKLTNALISKSAKELRDLETVEKIKVNIEPTKPPDLIPLEDMNEDEFMKNVINKETA